MLACVPRISRDGEDAHNEWGLRFQTGVAPLQPLAGTGPAHRTHRSCLKTASPSLLICAHDETRPNRPALRPWQQRPSMTGPSTNLLERHGPWLFCDVSVPPPNVCSAVVDPIFPPSVRADQRNNNRGGIGALLGTLINWQAGMAWTTTCRPARFGKPPSSPSLSSSPQTPVPSWSLLLWCCSRSGRASALSFDSLGDQGGKVSQSGRAGPGWFYSGLGVDIGIGIKHTRDGPRVGFVDRSVATGGGRGRG